MMETTKTLVLRSPIQLGEVVYTEISLREPVAKELEAQNGSNVALISMVAAIPRAVAEKLSARDYMEAVGFLNSFLQPVQVTGETSLLT